MGLNNDDIKQLIAILQRGLSDDNIEENIPKKKPKAKKQDKNQQRKNLFNQMAEFRMHKEDVEIDRKLKKQPPTERTRSYKPISVKCRVCGKSEEINPSLIESIERYKCNRCCTSPG
jgi:lysyl-tRNA synthetase class I